MNEMDEKREPLNNSLKLIALGKKRFSLWKKQNDNPKHVSLRKRGLSCFEEQLPLRRNGELGQNHTHIDTNYHDEDNK